MTATPTRGTAVRAVRATGAAAVAVVDLPTPPGTGELVRLRAAGVCALDRGYVDWGSTHVLGHELSGVLEDGTPVVRDGRPGCGACDACRRGRSDVCPTLRERALGLAVDGGMATAFRAPVGELVRVPPELDLVDACLVEPTAVSLHAVRTGEVGPGTRVAVVGGGPVGLLAAACARHVGSPEVLVEARYAYQYEAAERLGAQVRPSGRYDVVVEATGTHEGLARAVQLVAPLGTLVVAGIHMGVVEVDWFPLYARGVRVLPAAAYCSGHDSRSDLHEAATVLLEAPEVARTLITHRFPLEDAVHAFAVAGDRSTGALRVVLEA